MSVCVYVQDCRCGGTSVAFAFVKYMPRDGSYKQRLCKAGKSTFLVGMTKVDALNLPHSLVAKPILLQGIRHFTSSVGRLPAKTLRKSDEE